MKRLLLSLASIGLLVFLWEWLYRSDIINLFYFPPPSQFITFLFEENFNLGLGPERQNIFVSIVASSLRVLIGLIFSFSLGLLIGMGIWSIPLVNSMMMPIVRLFAPIAPIAWIPLALAIFGIGNVSAVFLVFMGTFFILVIATIGALNSIDRNLINVAKTLGADSSQIWRHVIVPSIIPNVFTILRINFIGAWMAVLAAEMVGLRDGLGAIILIGRESSNPDLILVGMTLIGIVGFIFDAFLIKIQKRIFWWSHINI